MANLKSLMTGPPAGQNHTMSPEVAMAIQNGQGASSPGARAFLDARLAGAPAPTGVGPFGNWVGGVNPALPQHPATPEMPPPMPFQHLQNRIGNIQGMLGSGLNAGGNPLGHPDMWQHLLGILQGRLQNKLGQ